jgi:hypothetical protein
VASNSINRKSLKDQNGEVDRVFNTLTLYLIRVKFKVGA